MHCCGQTVLQDTWTVGHYTAGRHHSIVCWWTVLDWSCHCRWEIQDHASIKGIQLDTCLPYISHGSIHPYPNIPGWEAGLSSSRSITGTNTCHFSTAVTSLCVTVQRFTPGTPILPAVFCSYMLQGRKRMHMKCTRVSRWQIRWQRGAAAEMTHGLSDRGVWTGWRNAEPTASWARGPGAWARCVRS